MLSVGGGVLRAGRGAVEADDSHIVGHADAVVSKGLGLLRRCGIVVNAEDAIGGREVLPVARVVPGNGTQQ